MESDYKETHNGLQLRTGCRVRYTERELKAWLCNEVTFFKHNLWNWRSTRGTRVVNNSSWFLGWGFIIDGEWGEVLFTLTEGLSFKSGGGDKTANDTEGKFSPPSSTSIRSPFHLDSCVLALNQHLPAPIPLVFSTVSFVLARLSLPVSVTL